MFRQNLKLKWFTLALSLWNLLMYNIPFFRFVSSHAEMGLLGHVWLLLTMTLVMLALNYAVFYLLLRTLRGFGRGLIALTFILSALAAYFVVNYHVLMDESMMGNVFNTRYSEASGYFRWSLWLFWLMAGWLPAIYVCCRKVEWGSWRQLGIHFGSSLGASLLLVLLSLNQVLWVGKYDTELGGLLMPWGYLVNTGRLAAHRAAENEEEVQLPLGHFVDQHKTAVVLVIGESARRANFQLYGYRRPTNPRLSKLDDLAVLQAQSLATYTTAGVRAMLEPRQDGPLYEILPNYLGRCGADVVWRTSNWGEPPVKVGEYVTRDQLWEQICKVGMAGNRQEPHDEVLFWQLGNRIRRASAPKVFIVIHTSTSHGPDYQMQYPSEFECFRPVCSRVEDAEKEPANLRNAYDNTIRYTDDYLCNLIDTLRVLAAQGWQTSMIYMSDHGESLGENGLFMHGMPLKVAPKEQYEVPLLLWTSDTLSNSTLSNSTLFDQSYVYHTVLHLLGLQSEVYDPEKDILR